MRENITTRLGIKEPKQYFKHAFISIRYKIIITLLLMVSLPLFFAGYYFNYTNANMLKSNLYSSIEEQIAQTNKDIESSFVLLQDSINLIVSTTIVNNYVVNTDVMDEDMLTRKEKLEKSLNDSLLFNTAWTSKLLNSIYLFIDDKNYVSISRSPYGIQTITSNFLGVYNKLNPLNNNDLMILPPSNNDQTIYFYQELYNINTNEKIYTLIMGMDENVLYETYKNINSYSNSKAFVFDDMGNIYSNSDKSLLGKSMQDAYLTLEQSNDIKEIEIDNQIYYMAFKKIQNSNLSVIVGVPKNEAMETLKSNITNYILITSLILLISLFLSFAISFKFTGFINDMFSSISKIKSGNYSVKMPSYKNFELSQLSNTFNDMAEEINYLINEIYQKQLLLKDTELKFLQSQMNPHFLFNSLVTIGLKAKLSHDESIYKMTNSLGKLLQASIYSNNNDKITVRQEMEFVEFYLYLQKSRFEDRLDYSININDDAVLDCYLPKLCIEPIVENAVIHGLENKLDNGKILINIIKYQYSIKFEIIDNGIGFGDQKIDLDDDVLINSYKEGHTNIGLRNTHKRIKLMYGDQYGITIQSTPDLETRVVVSIPVDYGDLKNV